MRIVVTGSEGVIGQSLVPRLLAEGHQVLRFDKRISPVQCDVTSYVFVKSAFVAFNPDVVIHMAAQVGRITGEEMPHTSVDSNMMGTLNVVLACIETGARLINFSTSEVYGHNSIFGTPDILEQNGMYGLTKLAAEGIVKHYVSLGKLKAVSVRPFMVYGPHEVPNGVYRSAVSNFIDAAMNGSTFYAHNGCVRSWCFADDFVDGLMLLLDYEPDGYEAISIGTDEYRSMEECGRIVLDVVGNGAMTVVDPPEFLVSCVKQADFSKIQSLGFSPKVSLEEGVKRTYAAFVGRK